MFTEIPSYIPNSIMAEASTDELQISLEISIQTSLTCPEMTVDPAASRTSRLSSWFSFPAFIIRIFTSTLMVTTLLERLKVETVGLLSRNFLIVFFLLEIRLITEALVLSLNEEKFSLGQVNAFMKLSFLKWKQWWLVASNGQSVVAPDNV